MTDLLSAAVLANAGWCDEICRLVGLPVQRGDRLWWTSRRSPQFYPDAVTLTPDVTAAEVLARVDGSAGCSVKDSFATLDLSADGFRVLFEADWIGAPASPAEVRPRLSWQPVTTEDALARWSAAHGEAPALGPRLLTHPGIRLLLASDGDRLCGGLALNRSGGGVGVANLFVTHGDPRRIWADVAPLAAQVFPGLPPVGYEAGADLEPALASGFGRLGPLRVWLRDPG